MHDGWLSVQVRERVRDREREMGNLFELIKKVKPYLAMVALQFGYAGLRIITVLGLKRGLNPYVLTVYRHVVATAVVAPFAFALERKVRPKLTLSIFFKIAVLALLEPVIDQNLNYIGMTYTSATFATALYNILPATTFIMAILFRLEKVKIKKLPSQAKVLGTVFTVGGAMLMTLYKGPIIDFIWSRGRVHHDSNRGAADHDWIKGTLMIIASCFGWSSFFILQSFTLRDYPVELSMTTLICFMAIVEGGAVALVMNRNVVNAWSIGWDSRLLAPVYAGVVCSGIAYYVQGMVMKERGPVFVTAFNPLCMVIVAVLGSFILAEEISLGRVLGAIIIVIGLYCVVWAKSKDALEPSPSTDKPKGAPDQLPMTNSSKTVSGDSVSGGETLKVEIQAKEPTSKK